MIWLSLFGPWVKTSQSDKSQVFPCHQHNLVYQVNKFGYIVLLLLNAKIPTTLTGNKFIIIKMFSFMF